MCCWLLATGSREDHQVLSNQHLWGYARSKRALFCYLLVLVLSVTRFCTAQGTGQPESDKDDQGSLHSLALGRIDRGGVSDLFVTDQMLLLLRRSPEQEAQLDQFLEDVHSPASVRYHKWLSPQQFGQLYGPNDSDVNFVLGSLQHAGFKIIRITQGKTAIEFSGTAAQVREFFHADIHVYEKGGVQYHATNQQPQIPQSLVPIVAGITPMNDFPIKLPQTRRVSRTVSDAQTGVVRPNWTQTSANYLLTPGDFSIQYDLQPAYSVGNNGAGVTVGVISAADVNPAYVAAYQSLFNLPAKPVQMVLAGNDPGTLNDDQEALLDVEVLNGVAPGAAINLYAAQGTSVQQGVNLAALKAVEDNVAPVLTVSYGFCEQTLGSGGNLFWNSVWQQAAAQGQTVLVSAGDFGSAGCDNLEVQPIPRAIYGLAVNGIASTPWNVAVGGTDFYYSTYAGTASARAAEVATYWNSTSTSLPTVSILRPIPEQQWNTAFGANLNNTGVYDPSVNSIYAGAGGRSSCIAGGSNSAMLNTCTGSYPKPAWQRGIGVPADGVRDLPDVSLFAAGENSNGSAYVICARPTDCIVSNGSVMITTASGTSASTPAMAGIMALVVQRYGRQGQANHVLYPLAVQHPSVFRDIEIGTNDVPCIQGSPNCTLSAKNDNTAGVYTFGQYPATPGYDLATGLGSVNANLLLQYWNSVSPKPAAALTGAASPNSLNTTQSTVMTAAVSSTGGLPSPTGSVSIGVLRSATPDYFCNFLPLTGGTASCSLPGAFLGQGLDSVIVSYSGDTNYGSSQIMLPVSVTALLSISGTPVSFTPGATAGNSSTITVSGLQGFAGLVALTCSLTESPLGAQKLAVLAAFRKVLLWQELTPLLPA